MSIRIYSERNPDIFKNYSFSRSPITISLLTFNSTRTDFQHTTMMKEQMDCLSSHHSLRSTNTGFLQKDALTLCCYHYSRILSLDITAKQTIILLLLIAVVATDHFQIIYPMGAQHLLCLLICAARERSVLSRHLQGA